MFYKMSDEFSGNIRSLLSSKFTSKELDDGLKAFECLINIESSESTFDQEYGEFLNGDGVNLLSVKWDVIKGCRVEGFLRKICILKGENTDGTMLVGFYTKIGFFNWLNDNEIKAARANDAVNAANAQNLRGGDGFKLAEADATKYRGCPHWFDAYITTYQIRNQTKAHDNPISADYKMRLEIIENLFTVYMDQCIKNYALITGSYEKELISTRVNYVEFASEKIKNIESFNKTFMQLNWFDDDNEQFSCDFSISAKFVGEAGMGKTTQMMKMYYEILKLVKAGNKNILPIWVQLSEMSELQDITLREKVEEILGEYAQYYDLLLRNNILMFFLDGYNEVLTKDMQDTVKRKLAKDIDDIHAEYPQTIIAMTDRVGKSNPPCLMKNVKTYTFNGLNDKETMDYIRLKTTSEVAEKIAVYLKGESSAWVGKSKIIPAKLNSLIDLFEEGTVPTDEDDFYDKYLDFILDREANMKKETRIDDLKYLLYIFAQQLDHPGDEMNQNEILKLWKDEGGVDDLAERRRMFKLVTELPVLVPGSNDHVFKFAYPQYYQKMYEGL